MNIKKVYAICLIFSLKAGCQASLRTTPVPPAFFPSQIYPEKSDKWEDTPVPCMEGQPCSSVGPMMANFQQFDFLHPSTHIQPLFSRTISHSLPLTTLASSSSIQKCSTPTVSSIHRHSSNFPILSTSKENHTHTHNNFECQYCSKTFTQKISLVRHIRIHTGEKPFKCQYCSKSFSQKSNLKTHIRIHTGEKPFKCTFCDESFARKDYLTKHIQTHAKNKPFKCTFCDKSFGQKSNLKTHIRIHTGERPFKCQYCSKSFIQKSNLKRHIRIHTGEKPFQCQFCDERFTQKGILRRHIKTHKTSIPPHQPTPPTSQFFREDSIGILQFTNPPINYYPPPLL